MLGLGDIYPRAHMQTAIASVFKYNFVPDCRKLLNTGYILAMNDDAGLVICSWPKGGRPAQALFYADTIEVGYEDQVAGNLINHGHLLEGLAVMKAIRDRFDGRKRDPYCQIQYGGYYIRSLANYSLLLALTGFRYTAVDCCLWLDPKLQRDALKTFFATDGAWGTLTLEKTGEGHRLTIYVAAGELPLRQVVLFGNQLTQVDAKGKAAYLLSAAKRPAMETTAIAGGVEVTVPAQAPDPGSSVLVLEIPAGPGSSATATEPKAR